MPSLASLVASIHERLAALRGEIDRLQQSRALASDTALADGQADRAERATGAPGAIAAGAATRRDKAVSRSGPQTLAARPAKRAGGARRRIAPLTAAAVEQLLAGHAAGLSAGAIAEQAQADYAATLALLRELEASGQVRREGARRTTAWRLITDEDRIAQRAAEFERLARASGTRQPRPRGRARAAGEPASDPPRGAPDFAECRARPRRRSGAHLPMQTYDLAYRPAVSAADRAVPRQVMLSV